MKMNASVLAGVLAAALGALACVAQQPKVENAQVTVRASGLQAAVAAAHTPTWVGYSMALRHPMHNNWGDSVAYLEGGDHRIEPPDHKPGDPAPRADVLLRVTGGRVERVQLEDGVRTIDAGGLPLVWVSDVQAAEAVKVLTAAVDDASAATPAEPGGLAGVKVYATGRAHLETAILTLALAEAPEAMAALRGLTAPKYPSVVRDRAAFWLANEGGREGLDAVTALLRSEKDDGLREKLIFDLTLVKGDGKAAATDELLELAKNEPSPKVRSKAQFWLAQMAAKRTTADPRLTEMLRDSATNDPESAMRKSAVFALSRLPTEQAVPELIQVASTSKDPSTRREAIFWLGQKNDPRALQYLEKVVKE